MIPAVGASGPGLREITAEVDARVRGTARAEGVPSLVLCRTSASLLIQENAAPDVRADLEAFFRRLVPRADDPAMGDRRHRLEGADDMPAHIKAALLP